MTDRNFRVIVVASLVTGLFGGTVDIIFPGLVTESLREAQAELDGNVSMSRSLLHAMLALPTAATAIASYYGLFMYRAWAPRLALVCTALVLLVVLVIGSSSASSWAAAASTLSSYLWGAALVLAHTPAYGVRFQST